MKFYLGTQPPNNADLSQVQANLWLDQSFTEITSGTWQSGYVIDRDWRSGNYITITSDGKNTYNIETSYFKDSHIVFRYHPACINNLGLGAPYSLDTTDFVFDLSEQKTTVDNPITARLATAWFREDRLDINTVADGIYNRLSDNLKTLPLVSPVSVAYTFGLDSGVTAALVVEQCLGPRLVVDQSCEDLARLLPWPYHDVSQGKQHSIDGVPVHDFFDYESLIVSHWGDHVLLRKPDILPDTLDRMFFWQQTHYLLAGQRYHNQSQGRRYDIYRDPAITAQVLRLNNADLQVQIHDSWIQKHILRQRFPKWWTVTFRTKNQRSSMIPHGMQEPGRISHIDTIDLFTASLNNS